MHLIEGTFEGNKNRFVLIASRFNEFVTEKLVDGACNCLRRHGVADTDITIIWVPGAFEIPFMAQKAAKKLNCDAIICLGAVIQGATNHHEYVANNAISGIANQMIATDIPMSLGIVTARNVEQAIERAGIKQGNMGWNAALSSLEMVNCLKHISEVRKE